jgi:hypothetical protein
MNQTEIIALYDQDQRKDVEYAGARREITPNVVRHVDLSGRGEGAVIYTQLGETNAEAIIREQVAYFESLGQNFEWKLYDYDQPADLRARLEVHGFIVEEAEAIMVLDLEEASETLWQPVLHDVRRIMDGSQIYIHVDDQRSNLPAWQRSRYLGPHLGERQLLQRELPRPNHGCRQQHVARLLARLDRRSSDIHTLRRRMIA